LGFLYSNRIDLRIKATRGLIPLSINKTEQLKLESAVICKPFLFEYIWMFLPRLIYGKRKDKNNMSHFFANIARKIVGIALIIFAVINLIQTLFYFESNESNKKTFGLKQSEFLCEHCTTNCLWQTPLKLKCSRNFKFRHYL
jgi:ABC-type multidrug transport system permease subunit